MKFKKLETLNVKMTLLKPFGTASTKKVASDRVYHIMYGQGNIIIDKELMPFHTNDVVLVKQNQSVKVINITDQEISFTTVASKK
jgi:gentisate 1,2-dioxygenase